MRVLEDPGDAVGHGGAVEGRVEAVACLVKQRVGHDAPAAVADQVADEGAVEFGVGLDRKAGLPIGQRRVLAKGALAHGLRAGRGHDDLVLVHAGIRPGVPMAHQTRHDLCWIRDAFLDDRRDHGKLVVHGHTPVDAATHAGNRVNLDTGAAYGGPISAAVFEGRDCWILTPEGRVPLAPPT